MQSIFDQHLSHLVQADIVFGSPRRDCRNLGICRVDTSDILEGTTTHTGCPVLPANLLVDAYGRLLILFPETGVSPEVAAQHFANDVFTVDDAYTLPPHVCNALGRPGGRLTILPGSFPVLQLGEGYLLSLPLLAVSNEIFGREDVYQEMLREAVVG